MAEPVHPFHGIYPVLYAFHTAENRIDEDAMGRQVEHCLAGGAHGLMVLGLITEVQNHTTAERLEIVAMTTRMLAGRKPLMVTCGEPTPSSQTAFAKEVRGLGADVVILQPPASIEGGERELLRFFGTTADAVDFPIAIQHNPFNLKVNLSVDGLVALHRNHPNITVLKGEGTAVETEQVVAGTDGKLAVFCGHGGLEFLSNLRAGVAGLIPAPDHVGVQVRIYELFRKGGSAALAEAEDLHRAILPQIVFRIRSIEQALCYGKRHVARRIGIEIAHERNPAMAPTAFGMAELDRFAAALRELEGRLGLTA